MGVVGWLVGWGIQSATKAPGSLPIGGLLISVATLIAVAFAGEVPIALWSGIGLIWLLTTLVLRLGGSSVAIALASVPGAVVVALAATEQPGWVRAVVVLSVPILGFLLGDFESRYGVRGLGVIYFGLAAFGSFLAVPDTESIRTLFAVALPISFLAWPRVRVSVGPPGAYLVAALLVLFTSEGGTGRPASVIGALACLGLVIVEPVAVRIKPRIASLAERLPSNPAAVLIAAVPQFVIVMAASRIAARTSSFTRATLVVVVVFGLSYAAMVWASEQHVDMASRPRFD